MGSLTRDEAGALDGLRDKAKERGRAIAARRRRRREAGAALVAIVVVAGVLIATRDRSTKRSVVAGPPTTSAMPVSTSDHIVALTRDGDLVEFSARGQRLRQLASINDFALCDVRQSCPSRHPGVDQATLAYNRASSEVLLVSPAGVVVVPLAGGTPRPAEPAQGAAVSVDGELVAFTTGGSQSGRADVFVRPATGGTAQTWSISGPVVAAATGLLNPAAVEDMGVSRLAWSADNRHLFVTLYLSFALNAANTRGVAYFEVVDLDTGAPVSTTNPHLIGPTTPVQPDAEAQSAAIGWDQATPLDRTHLLVLRRTEGASTSAHPESLYCAAPDTAPTDLGVVDTATGQATDLKVTTPKIIGTPDAIACPAQLLGFDSTGRYLLLRGPGPLRLELWDRLSTPSSASVIADDIVTALWVQR